MARNKRIKILLLIFAVGIIYILHSESQKLGAPLPDFIREPTVTDVQPTLNQGSEEDEELEDWWFSAVLKGEDDKTYVFKVLFDNVPRVRILFSELQKENRQHTDIECLSYEMQKTIDGVVLNCSFPNGYAKADITPPDNSYLSFSSSQNTLELSFKSRGLPYWFNNGFAFRKGFVDLTTVTGVLTKNGKETGLSGYGVFEHVLFDMTEYRNFSYVVWNAINFDQGYVFLFEIQGKEGYFKRDAAVSINDKYDYVTGTNSITIEHEIEDNVILQNHIIIDTDYGTLEIFGTLEGIMDFIPLFIHTYTGKFTYNDGSVQELTGGVSIDCICK